MTHRNILANIASSRQVIPADPRYRLLSILPLSHMLEQTAGLYLPLSYGASVVYPSSRQSPVIFKALRRHHISVMVVVPQVLSLMLDGIEREVRRQGKGRQYEWTQRLAGRLPLPLRRRLFRRVHRELGGRLDFFLCGGAPVPPELATAWERLGVKVVLGYGTTECAPIIASNSLRTRRHDSVGPPLPGVRVRLSDEGEVQVKGDNVTPGYWRDESATRAAFTEDGWYRTGDLAQMDAGGYLTLKGRLVDRMVLPSGLKVYPEDVEQVLRQEAAVADCVVVGLPDAVGNARVHAALIPADAAMDELAQRRRLSEAVRQANARLAPQQRISGFTVWARGDFSRTHLQKVKRHEVLAALAGEAAPRPALSPPGSPQDDRLARLGAIISAVGGADSGALEPQSDLTLDLQLDSLSRIALAAQVEDQFGVSLDDGDLAAVQTVGQLLDLLDRGAAVVPPIAWPVWARARSAAIIRAMLQQALIWPAHRCVCRPLRIEGREHLRSVALPVLLVANHSSHLDTPSVLRALPAAVRRRTAVAAAADYFYRTPLVGRTLSLVLNTFPFSREGAVRSSLEYCGELADTGWSILIYPEGTRSPTGRLAHFKSGIGLLAQELHLSVVPIAIEGTHAILPKGQRCPRPGPVTIRIGAPLSLAPSGDYAGTTALLESAVLSALRGDDRCAEPVPAARSTPSL